MISVSDRFLAALLVDHIEINKIELWSNNLHVRDLEVDENNPGTITLDSTSQTLRQATLNLASPLDVPGSRPDDLWPINTEIKIYSGFRYADGDEELIPQGVFVLDETAVDTVENPEVNLILFDRSYRISDNRFTKPFPLASMLATDAIKIIVEDRCKRNFNYDFPDIGYTIPNVILEHGGQSDPWADCLEIAESIGMQLFFDAYGNLVLRPLPEDDIKVFSYTDDKDNGILLGTSRQINRSNAYSGVVLSSQSPDASPIGAMEIWDEEDPDSTTYVGTFGYKAYFIDTQFIADDLLNRPQEILEAKLKEVKGISELVTIEVIANFAHEQRDVVEIVHEAAKIGALFSIDAYTRSLAVGSSLEITARKRKIFTI